MYQSGSASQLKRHSPWPGLGCSRTQHFSIGVSPTGELTVPRKLLCDSSAIMLVPKSLRDPVVSSELKHTWPHALPQTPVHTQRVKDPAENERCPASTPRSLCLLLQQECYMGLL